MLVHARRIRLILALPCKRALLEDVARDLVEPATHSMTRCEQYATGLCLARMCEKGAVGRVDFGCPLTPKWNATRRYYGQSPCYYMRILIQSRDIGLSAHQVRLRALGLESGAVIEHR